MAKHMILRNISKLKLFFMLDIFTLTLSGSGIVISFLNIVQSHDHMKFDQEEKKRLVLVETDRRGNNYTGQNLSK